MERSSFPSKLASVPFYWFKRVLRREGIPCESMRDWFEWWNVHYPDKDPGDVTIGEVVCTLRRHLGEIKPVVTLGGRGEPVTVYGTQLPPLSTAQYDVVQALIEAGEAGLGKKGLEDKSHRGDAVKILQRIRDKDPKWAKAIIMPGEPWKGYRIRQL